MRRVCIALHQHVMEMLFRRSSTLAHHCPSKTRINYSRFDERVSSEKGRYYTSASTPNYLNHLDCNLISRSHLTITTGAIKSIDTHYRADSDLIRNFLRVFGNFLLLLPFLVDGGWADVYPFTIVERRNFPPMKNANIP
jgi:hypothetical protein